jgi:CRP/FNR family transcriptional regulator, dissimilatory nitrate respiration regulator
MIDLLHDTIMFKVFDAKQLADLDKMTTQVELDAEQVLFQQGQEFKCFYYVVSGIIKLSSVSMDGSENVIEIMQKEHFFAESLMFINKPLYPVQAASVVKTTLFAIDAKKYRDLISQSENAMMHLLGDFSHRIHQLVSQIEDISFHSTKSRVASYILRCCDMHSSLTFSLDIPKNIIASRLSMKPETFSRALHFFDGKGIIKVSKRTIEVHNKDELIEFINKESQC